MTLWKRVRLIAFAGIVALAGPYDPTLFAAQDERPFPSVRDVRLDLGFDYERGWVQGRCRLTVVNTTPGPLSRLPLVLYRLMKVTAVTDKDGKALPFTQSVQTFEDWDTFQANVIDVGLLSPLETQQDSIIDLTYAGPLVGYAETGMRYVKDRVEKAFTIVRRDALAYPQVGYPSWTVNRAAGLPKFDYEVTVAVPPPLYAANGGRLVGRERRGGLEVFRYRSLKPAWRIDVAVADYRVLEGPGGLRVVHFADDADGAADIRRAWQETVSLYTSWFGPAGDAGSFTIIEIPEGYGSQADVTAILQTRDAFRDRSQMTQLYHEAAHLWDFTALDPLPARFESEGKAMFLQYLARERLEGKAGALEEGAKRVLERYRTAQREQAKLRETPMIDFGRADLTDHAYTKGMIFFYLLYRKAGEERFLRAAGDVGRRFRTAGATSREFLDALEQALGLDLKAFYADWVFGTGADRVIREGATLEDLVRRYGQD
jgi:hypothetical protein